MSFSSLKSRRHNDIGIPVYFEETSAIGPRSSKLYLYVAVI